MPNGAYDQISFATRNMAHSRAGLHGPTLSLVGERGHVHGFTQMRGTTWCALLGHGLRGCGRRNVCRAPYEGPAFGDKAGDS